MPSRSPTSVAILRRAVRAAVVDDEDGRVRESFADALEDVLDVGSFVVGRKHDEYAHRCSLPGADHRSLGPSRPPRGARASGSVARDGRARGDHDLVRGAAGLGQAMVSPEIARHHLDGARRGNRQQCPHEAPKVEPTIPPSSAPTRIASRTQSGFSLTVRLMTTGLRMWFSICW